MTKRLKYTKDILTHMLNNNNNGNTNGKSNNGAVQSATGSQRMQGQIGSAISSKRSVMTLGSDTGMPSSAMGRTGTMSNMMMMSSERKPLNVINQGVV